MRTFTVVANHRTSTNLRLGEVMTPSRAAARLRPGDVVLGRIDVEPSLQGIEPGCWALDLLEQRGITVLNRSPALAGAHDKLATARALARRALPHPYTEPVAAGLPLAPLELPVVLKPRFGSWGRDVVRCTTRAELAAALERARLRVWFNTAGGVLQRLVPPCGYDLRIVVGAGRVIGAAKRVAAPGEWRTNVALGARRVPVAPPPEARELALEAAAAIGGDLVGVDLLPADGGWTILEINGAVDFTDAYSFGGDVFAAARAAVLDAARLPIRFRRPQPAARRAAPELLVS
jgi:glutamate---[amino group carrier protein] ligase